MTNRTDGAQDRLARRVLGVLLAAVLVAFTAQQLLFPVLAPLSRELALTEFQLGLAITVAAVVFTLGSSASARWVGAASCLVATLVAVAHRGIAAATTPVPSPSEG